MAGQLAFSDDASGDGADFGNSEDLHDFRRADNLFLHHRFEHAFDGILDVVDRIVDDRIEADFDLLLSASLRADADGRTWKPTMMAFEAAANRTSDSEI